MHAVVRRRGRRNINPSRTSGASGTRLAATPPHFRDSRQSVGLGPSWSVCRVPWISRVLVCERTDSSLKKVEVRAAITRDIVTVAPLALRSRRLSPRIDNRRGSRSTPVVDDDDDDEYSTSMGVESLVASLSREPPEPSERPRTRPNDIHTYTYMPPCNVFEVTQYVCSRTQQRRQRPLPPEISGREGEANPCGRKRDRARKVEGNRGA